jgi:hypothetical protein
MIMSNKEYTGKRIRTEYGVINGHGVKLPVYERDIIMDQLTKKGFTDLLVSPFQEMTCHELKEYAGSHSD